MKLAVIPARGGSKRIPRKNLSSFCGKPILAYSIDAAIESGLFDHIVVSTDDTEIAECAKSLGAEVPFYRPDALADDYTGTSPVVNHALEWFENQGEKIEATCCIYPTAVFVTADSLRLGWQTLQQSKVDYVFTVTTFDFPIQRAMRRNDQGIMEVFDRVEFAKRSQDLEETYHDAGQFYWGRGMAFRGLPLDGNSEPLVLPRWLVQDIDTPEDWEYAERLFLLSRERASMG